jgi:Tfp pilus assembly protein PilW
VLLFLKDNGLMIVSIVGSLVIIGVIVYLIVNRRNRKLGQTSDEGAGVEEPVHSERVAD